MENGSVSGLPRHDRPRERLYARGPAELSLQELLAIVVGGGTRGSGALVLALRLLGEFGDLITMGRAGVDEMRRVPGIGFARACQLSASFELGRRLSRESRTSGSSIRAPRDIARMFMDEMKDYDREHFKAAFLNTKNRVIRVVTVSIGSLNASIVHPREILKPAIAASAASIILVHNHPTGDPTPSREDIEFTRRFAKCGDLIGIELLDHIVIGSDRFQSLKEAGYF
ncbi:MAG TPA: DNA repair protein RadC [Candidatus Krumholzibacteria bacterium]|nr:DNA repair protein RadC [Candidatus Krumholzibacteria bacterium]